MSSAASRAIDTARRTHRIGTPLTRQSAHEWSVEPQLIVPKRGRPYFRTPASARKANVEKEARKIQAKGTPSIVVTWGAILDEDMYEGDDLLPAGSFQVLSMRVMTDSLVTALANHTDTQAGLIVATSDLTGGKFHFRHIQTVYIREDRIGGGVG